jgi:hypothetical protein
VALQQQHITTVEANRTNPKRDLREMAGFKPGLDRGSRLNAGLDPGGGWIQEGAGTGGLTGWPLAEDSRYAS